MCGVINSFKSWRHFTFSLINCWKFTACQIWQHLQTQDAESHSLFNKCAHPLAQAWRCVSVCDPVLNHFIKSSVGHQAVLVSTAVTEGDRGCVQSTFLRVTRPTNKVLFCLFVSVFSTFFLSWMWFRGFLNQQLSALKSFSCGLEGIKKKRSCCCVFPLWFNPCYLWSNYSVWLTNSSHELWALLWLVWSLASLLFAPCTHRDFKSHLRFFAMQLLLAMVFLVMRAQCSESFLSDVFW